MPQNPFSFALGKPWAGFQKGPEGSQGCRKRNCRSLPYAQYVYAFEKNRLGGKKGLLETFSFSYPSILLTGGSQNENILSLVRRT